MKSYLEFERDIKVLEEELEKLKDPFNKEGISEVDTQRISEMQNEIDVKLKASYANLNEWQKTQVARHEKRPKAKFFIENLFTNFINLSGDRRFAEDEAVLAGFGLLDGRSILVIGQEKGEDLDSRLKRNFGMMRPEGYRKCIRLMKLADKFDIPIISFIDTPGAYPGVSSEERGQAQSIASSIECCMSLQVPNIAIVIGEGGSGGAIALATTNKVLMLEHSIYSVISPEGCASILWRDPSKTSEAAEAMKLSAKDLLKQEIIDEIIPEPIGGAHRDKELIAINIKNSITKNLQQLKKLKKSEILEHRKEKFLKIGKLPSAIFHMKNLEFKDNIKDQMKKNIIPAIIKRKKLFTGFIVISILVFFLYLIA